MMTEDRTAPLEDERSFAMVLSILMRNALCGSIHKLYLPFTVCVAIYYA